MYPRILTFSMKAIFLLLAISTTAGEKAAAPVHFTLRNVRAAEQAILSAFPSGEAFTLAREVKEEKRKARVCACELLKVSNNNTEQDMVAIFSEKTNNGDLSADYKTAISVLQKQKQNMKGMYYDKLKVNQTITAPTDCKTLYLKMIKNSNDVVMYDILDADILSALKNAK